MGMLDNLKPLMMSIKEIEVSDEALAHLKDLVNQENEGIKQYGENEIIVLDREESEKKAVITQQQFERHRVLQAQLEKINADILKNDADTNEALIKLNLEYVKKRDEARKSQDKRVLLNNELVDKLTEVQQVGKNKNRK